MMRGSSLLVLAALCMAPVAAQSQVAVDTATTGNDAADDSDQQVRCRRAPTTGSLVRRTRVCKTVAEWRRLSDRGNDVARQQFENGLVCSGGECRGN